MTDLRGSKPNFIRRLAAGLRPRRMSAGGECSGIVLALGGGFSRGFAHLGVLDVLEREQMPISAIVGISIGGLLGAAYADGIPVQDLCDLGRQVSIRDFLRFQRMGRGTERKDCLGRFVTEWFQARRVEELPIPTKIVTTDIDTGAPYVFTTGPLEVAIRATCAFPGLFKPVEHEGRTLADGCLVAPVPTAVAAGMNRGCVLGVAVGSNLPNTSSSSETVVRVMDQAIRTSRPSPVEPSWSRHADVLLEPEVHHIDWNDFSRVDEAFAAGAEAMRRALPSVRQILARNLFPVPCSGQLAASEGGVAL